MNTRSIIAVFIGIVVGAIVINLAQIPLSSMYPTSKETLLSFKDNYAAYEKYMLSRPLGVYVLIIISNALGILISMVVSRFIDKQNAMSMFAAAGLLLLGNIVTLIVVPHPSWFPFADMATSIGLALGYGGYAWGRRKKA